MSAARMLGKVAPPWCPVCKGEPGPDCPGKGMTPRQVRHREKAEVRREIETEREAS